MKNIVLALVSLLIVSNFAKAQEIKVVRGKLLDNQSINGRINKVIFTEHKREVFLENEYVELASCLSGKFEIVKNSNGKFELEKVVSCDEWVDETEEVEYCPESFFPVCGELPSPLGKHLPEVVTFSNSCELYKAKAAYLYSGECR